MSSESSRLDERVREEGRAPLPPPPDGPGRPLNICFVLPPPERYGARSGGAISTVTRHLVRSLIGLGHAVVVLTPDDGEEPYAEGDVRRLRYGPAWPPPALLHKARVLESKVRRWSWPDYGSYRRQVVRGLSRLAVPPDLVIAANDPELAYRLHRKNIGSRQVLWLHNRLQGREARRIPDLQPEVMLVAVSDSVRRWTADTYRIPADSISVINNGVDLDEFRPREDFVRPRTPVRVVCHGRIDPNKGHVIAARAVGELRRRGCPVTFTMIGGVQTFGIPEVEERAYADALSAAIADAGGTEMGRLPATEIAGVLREHDIACVLSRSAEPFPLTALEAMASGCAVITTGNGGIAEIVGESAVLVDTDDVDGVVAAIAGLADDPGLLSERKTSARRRSELFTWRLAADAVESLSTGSRRRSP